MTGSIVLKFKNTRWLFCVFFSIVLIVMMIVSNISVEDKRMIERPLSQTQFLYSLLKEDYESGKAVNYDYIEKEGEKYSPYTMELLYNTLVSMNPYYSVNEDVYDIDFSAINEEQFQSNLLAFTNSSKSASFFLPSYFKRAYSLYMYNSPYFQRVKDKGKKLAQKMINYIEISALSGYEKKMGLLVHKIACTDEESEKLMNIAERLERLIDNEDEDDLVRDCEKAYSELDTMLGGNTNFQRGWVSFEEPGTIENATETYQKMESNNELTDAYVRLFTDYMGILAGTLPIIIAAFCLSNGGKRKNEIVFSKSISSRKIVLGEFTCTLSVYAFIFACVYIVECVKYINLTNQGNSIECCLVFIKYLFFMIFPTMIVACALPMAIFEVANNCVVSVVISMTIMFFSLSDFSNNYPMFSPILRFNYFGNTEEYLNLLPCIVINRISVIVLSIALLIISTRLYEYRRKNNK